MLNDLTSYAAALATRRSGKPRDLVAPGPTHDQLLGMVELAARTPDHGKLAPWRFVLVASEQRDAFARLLHDAQAAEGAPWDRDKVEEFARQAPALIVMLSSPRRDSPIPLWEQQLSAGAAAMNLLHAAHAAGFAAGWLTGWPSESHAVRDAFGGEGERIVGFFFIGTPSRPLSDRPRPAVESIASDWDG